MGAAILQFGVAVVIIVAAGTLLARSADAIARVTGLGRLLVGSVLLAGATSLPELTIGLNALSLDLPDIAVGNLAGSCLFNLLILAVADLLHHTKGGLLSRTAAAHALSGTVSIAVTAIAGVAILAERQVEYGVVARLGPGSFAILGAYLFGIRLVFHDQRVSAAAERGALPKADGDEAGPRPGVAAPHASTWRPILGYLVGAVVIFITAPLLARAAGDLADKTGLGGTFVGTSLVALATSLPELVATWAALRIGAFDLAIGNIFGSNTFNILLLVPLDLAFGGPLLASVSLTHALTCLAVIVITSVVILGQLYRVERRVMLLGPDATLVIVMVIAALGMIYAVG